MRPETGTAVLAADPAPDQWVSAHLFYHDQLDGLLRELVGPLVTELAGDGLSDDFFFLRYWDGGPHLRLRCRSRPEQVPAVRRRILDHASRFFRERPAASRVDPHEYAAEAAQFARIEGITRYAPRPYPDPQVSFITYRPEYHRYGTGPAMAAVERHFAESSRIALGVLAHHPTLDHRVTAGLCMTLLSWFTAEPDQARLAGRLRASPLSGGDHDPAAERTAGELAGRMRTLAGRIAQTRATGSLARWGRSVNGLVGALTAAGAPDPIKVLDQCAHLMCNRLGLSSQEETELRRLAVAVGSEADHPASARLGAQPARERR